MQAKDEQRTSIAPRELLRWLLIVGLILIGIGLYFRFARSTQPVAPPSVEESPR